MRRGQPAIRECGPVPGTSEPGRDRPVRAAGTNCGFRMECSCPIAYPHLEKSQENIRQNIRGHKLFYGKSIAVAWAENGRRRLSPPPTITSVLPLAFRPS